ncbi:MAG: c-type cytochrome [Hyphomicrobiaceae bacterium]
MMVVRVWSKARRLLALAALVTVTAAGTAGVAMKAGAEDKPPQTRPSIDYCQPAWMVRELWGPGRMPKGMMTRILRHMTYMNYGVPEAYDGAKSTVLPSPQTTAAGGKLFAQHCQGCHGRDGLGDGDAANALSPSPALLAFMIRRPISVDEYLLWAISDGGAQFGSAMPAFKDTLKRDEIWKIIAYMRAGFPIVDKSGKSVPPAKAK